MSALLRRAAFARARVVTSGAATRTSGQAGEAVVAATSATTSAISLYLDTDNVAEQVINVIHESGLIINASDFVL